MAHRNKNLCSFSAIISVIEKGCLCIMLVAKQTNARWRSRDLHKTSVKLELCNGVKYIVSVVVIKKRRSLLNGTRVAKLFYSATGIKLDTRDDGESSKTTFEASKSLSKGISAMSLNSNLHRHSPFPKYEIKSRYQLGLCRCVCLITGGVYIL